VVARKLRGFPRQTGAKNPVSKVDDCFNWDAADEDASRLLLK
jgi:hypothetical protein